MALAMAQELELGLELELGQELLRDIQMLCILSRSPASRLWFAMYVEIFPARPL
jgi:hypothetical protein